ncbi:MAG: TonB-dependent receptor [Prevotellaceae bacterium]|jgi:hypothetical protein|nr:TonB-dependent receptor [Prevotellaceae bacterium]
MGVHFFRYLVVVPLFFLWLQKPVAQEAWTITGQITDVRSGEVLQGVFVRVVNEDASLHTDSDSWGSYTLLLPSRDVVLEFFCPGYKTERIDLKYAQHKKRVDVALEALSYLIEDLIVKGERDDNRIRRPDMGLERITSQSVKKIPLLLGEADIIKALHLLPGVLQASEGSSGFIVRGGSPDQNLVLFDHATIYNPSHMMGFFSVFNNDAISDVQLYKGDIPAMYGGRLSSLLDVEGRQGLSDFNVTGGIGLITSRLAVSGPIGKDITFLAAARRTYADAFLKLSTDSTINSAILHFYDLNGKMRWHVNERNWVTFSLYNGSDRFGTHGIGFNFGNSIGSLAWTHRFSQRLSVHTIASGTMYKFDFKATSEQMDGLPIEGRWLAGIKEAGLRTDFIFRWNEQVQTRFGWSGLYQWFQPGNMRLALQSKDELPTFEANMARKQAMVNTLYFSNEHKIFEERLHLRYGLRLTRFDNVGPTKQYYVDDAYEVTGIDSIPSGKFYHHEYGAEPRVALSFMLNDRMSLKASYSRTMQFVHLLSFSSAGSPLDIWIPANPSIKPQVANQYSVGFFNGFSQNKIQASVELFYKNLNHVLDFKDHPRLLLNDTIETEIRLGTGYSYGLECMVKKERGDLSGWISYTWLRSFRKINGVNQDKRYPASSDRPHNVSVVVNYQFPFYRRLEASVNWIYSTGQPFVMPEGRYWFFDEFIPVYSARNAYRMPDYHRMDASLIIHLGKKEGRFTNELNLSVYNVYGRKNPWMINYRMSLRGAQYTEMTYLFGIVPSVTWNFSF